MYTSPVLAQSGQPYAGSKTIRLSLAVKNKTVGYVLHALTERTGLNIHYDKAALDNDKRVTLAIRDAPLDSFLEVIAGQAGIRFSVLNNKIIVMADPPPAVDVHGKVTDKEGQPVVAVSVQIKGKTIGVQTDAEGRYSIAAAGGEVLIFSMVGYRHKEAQVQTSKEVNVVIEQDANQLDNVVITALGIKKEERRIGYSVTGIEGQEVQLTRELTFVNALAGKIAGLVVQSPPTGAGGSSRIILRGYSSLNGTNQPLYVIDGMPIVSSTREQNSNDGGKIFGGSDPGDGLATINPDDIETISILKGASAAALYGSYAQAGVIILTTKKGKTGQGLGISYNSNTVLEKVVPYDQNDLQYTYGRGNNGRLYTAADNVTGDNYLTALSWGARIQGQPFLDVDGVTRPYLAQKPGDQFSRFFRTGVTTANSLALSSATGNANYRVSLSQTSNSATTPYSGLSRYNAVFRALNDYGQRFHTDFKIDLSRTKRNNIPVLRGDDRGSFSKFFTRTANTTDLRLLNQKDALGRYRYTYTNPYVALEKVSNDETLERVLASANLTYDITGHLHAQVQAGIDQTNINGNFVVFPNNKANQTGLLTNTREKRERSNALAMLLYRNTYGKFSLRLHAGVQMDNMKNTSLAITGTGFVDSSLVSFNNVTVNDAGITPIDIRSRTYSVFTAAQLGYNNFLFLELTGRNDWYSTLTAIGKGSFDNSLFYPSANLSYVFTDALPLSSKVLSFGKLRASMGQTGGNLQPYLTNLAFTIQAPVNGSAGGFISSATVPPRSIQPEVTTEVEMGTELRFFHSRLGLDLAWYSKTTRDFLVNSSLSSAAGFSAVALNAGSMVNKGIELLLTGTPVQTRQFSWEVSFNAAHNKNKVLSLVPELAQTGIANYYNIKTKAGYPMGSIFGVPLRREANGQLVYKAIDTNGDGLPDAVVHDKGQISYDAAGRPVLDANGQAVINNNVFLGSANPDWTGGITNTFTYKKVVLSFLIDAQLGGYIYEDGFRWASFFGLTKATLRGREGNDVPRGVVNTGTDASPSFTANTLPFSPYQQYNGGGTLQYYADEMSVFRKTFIKMRQVAISYTLPVKTSGKSGIREATLSLIGRNLFYFKKEVPLFDPQSSDSINNGFGFDSGGLPTSRTYGFNLSVRF